jgi:NAD(P)-dependent dehydrogenase (short-subunit alcohol dehydrogenase family)
MMCRSGWQGKVPGWLVCQPFGMATTYLITGANRGIGLEYATQLRARGDTVIATCRDVDKAAELQSTGAEVLALDVTSEQSIADLGKVVSGRAVDVLINNAGVSSTSKSLADCTQEELARVLLVNSIAPILVTKAVLPALQKGTTKLIVHISSQLGSIANNTGGSSYGYRASKAALNQFNRSLSAELAPEGFHTLCMHPGWVRTDMGGPHATLSAQESVRSMLSVIAKARDVASGSFLNFDGKPLPW